MAKLRERYGAGPLHLLSAAVMVAIVSYAFIRVARSPNPLSFAIWFAGAIVAHDLIAFPLYSALNRLAGGATERLRPGAINYVRVPALLSLLALVVWFPLILRLSGDSYEAKAALSADGFLAKWLLLSAALALGSALAFVLRTRMRGHPREP